MTLKLVTGEQQLHQHNIMEYAYAFRSMRQTSLRLTQRAAF